MDIGAVDLERLILEPAETLEIEYKEWLDLQNKPHKGVPKKYDMNNL